MQAQPTPAFDVASVKPVPADCSPCPGGSGPTPGSQGYFVRNLDLRILITIAYRVDIRQVSGGPPWLTTDRFDIDAKAARPATAPELHEMLRTLIEERFHLKVRHEPRQESVWNLVVAKGGVKMPAHDPDDKDYPAIRGQTMKTPDGGSCPGLVAPNVSMDSFARTITRVMGRAVFDKTELTGRYDLNVFFRGESYRSKGEPSPDCPDAFAALPSQLGLKLEAAKGPVDHVIVEHAEKPTEN
jgi:uncharacterized protein (TIGR03435 family)